MHGCFAVARAEAITPRAPSTNSWELGVGSWELGGALNQAIRQCRTFNELEYQRVRAPAVFKPVDRRNVLVIQRGQDLRLALEAGEPVRVEGERFGKNFERDVAVELRVARAVHLAHTADAKRIAHLVRSEPSSWLQRHSIRGRHGIRGR